MSRFVELSHPVVHGMETYRPLPGPVIEDHLGREASREHYAPGTEFQIGRITMVANTGTYVDAPFHRYADGTDVAGLALESLAGIEGVVVRPTDTTRAIGSDAFAGLSVRGRCR